MADIPIDNTEYTDSGPSEEVVQLKESLDDYMGGADCNLKKKVKGRSVYEALKHEVGTRLQAELEAQSELIANHKVWEDIYKGKRPEKTYPYIGANNYAVPMTRWLVKNVLVRFIDVIFSQRRIWIVKAKAKDGDTPQDIEQRKTLAHGFEMALDGWAKSPQVNYKKKIFSPLLQGIKMGTGMKKFGYDKQKRTYVRYVTDEEAENPDIKVYSAGNGQKVAKIPIPNYTGPQIYPVSREDFVISSDEIDIQKSRFCGFRTYLSRNQIECKLKAKLYKIDNDFFNILNVLGAGDELDDVKRNRIENQGKLVNELHKDRYEIWELWMHYDIDNDGEDDDIVVTYHPSSGTIFRCIYNPFFYGFRPFNPIIPDPVEYSFDGLGAIESLKDLQEATDKTFNQEMDRSDQINSLNLLIEEGSGIPEDFQVYPGFTQEVNDPKTAIQEVKFSDTFMELAPRIQQINQMAEKTVGLSPHSLGQNLAERPVARETMMALQESNKVQKYLVDNGRENIKEDGWTVLELWSQHAPELTYQAMDDSGAYKTETITFPLEYLRDSFDLDLMASSEMLNMEVRREIAITKYQMVKDYYSTLTPLIQPLTDTSGMVPMEFKKWIIAVVDRSERLLEDILKEFGDPVPDDLVVDIEEALNPEALVNKPPPPTEKPPPGSPPPPGGPPGPGGPQGPPPGPPPPGAM